jgi:glyoxylate utilization-related uncharacterized protein
VSLTAVTLRWLEYTHRRSVFVVSNEGFAHWAKSSDAAFRAHRYIRTKTEVFELPEVSTGVTGEHSDETRSGVWRSEGTWFPEPVLEMCIRSSRYDMEFTLLHLEPGDTSPDHDEEVVEDSYDRFVATGQA